MTAASLLRLPGTQFQRGLNRLLCHLQPRLRTTITLAHAATGMPQYQIAVELIQRWTRSLRQLGGLAKVDRVGFYAANCSVICAVA